MHLRRPDEQDCRPLLVGQLVDRPLEITKLQTQALTGFQRRSVSLAQLNLMALACSAAEVIDMLMMEDRE